MAMPKRAAPPLPTTAELAILRILWERGPSSVRDIHEALPDGGTGYTTTLKLLQIMLEKGLVTRDEAARRHVYAARESAAATERGLVRDFVRRAFDGSAARLMMHVMNDSAASAGERAEIRRLIEAMDDA